MNLKLAERSVMANGSQSTLKTVDELRYLPMHDRRRSLAIGLLKAREAVMSHFRPILAGYDLTEQQWRVIRALWEAGTLDATEVAEKAFILAPSLTRMLRSLEERDYIFRHKDKDDGRRVLLTLAPAGRAIIDEVMPDSCRVYANFDARFGAARIEELIDVLEELADLRLESKPGADD